MPGRIRLRRLRSEPSETEIQAQCLQYLRALNIFCWRNNSTGVWDAKRQCYRTNHGMPGIADIAGVLSGGRAIYVEVKSRKGKLSPAQKEFLRHAGECGAIAICIRSVDELQRALKAEGVIA